MTDDRETMAAAQQQIDFLNAELKRLRSKAVRIGLPEFTASGQDEIDEIDRILGEGGNMGMPVEAPAPDLSGAAPEADPIMNRLMSE